MDRRPIQEGPKNIDWLIALTAEIGSIIFRYSHNECINRPGRITKPIKLLNVADFGLEHNNIIAIIIH